MAEEFVPPVEAPGVRAQEPLHAGDEIGLQRLGDEMEMISHETEGVDLPAGLGAGFAQSFEEGAPVVVIAKDGFAMIATAHEMVSGARELNAQRSWHSVFLLENGFTANSSQCARDCQL